MSGTSDKEFYKIFGYVTLFIVLLAVIIVILSNVFASSVTNDNYDAIKEKATEQRLSSSERINLESNPTFKTEVIEVVSSKSGKDIYNSVCMSCHMSGAAGAPITGKLISGQSELQKVMIHSMVMQSME